MRLRQFSYGVVCLLTVLMGCGDGEADLENSRGRPEATAADDTESSTDDDTLTDTESVSAASDQTDGKDSTPDSDTETETDTVPDTLLIDDCDDGDNVNYLDGLWVSYDDYHDPGVGESEVWPLSVFKGGAFTMSAPGYGDTGYAARITGTTATKLGYDYVGMIMALGPKAFCPDPEPAEIDLSQYTGLRFMAKGSATGGHLVVKIIHTKDGAEDNCQDNGLTGDTLTDWVDYAADMTSQLTPEWTEITLDFRKDFFSDSSVDIETVLPHAKDIHFFFQTTDGGTVDLTVDNPTLYRDDSVPTDPDDDTESDHPDMAIQDPSPPADDPIETIEITNPLQASALLALNKGYNLTNWLEAGSFEDFGDYNEQFVINLAAAGFKALRLPIDLDRYIANRDTYFSVESPFAVDPILFTILDAFDEWTLAHGLSLTIDYHQYDQTFDLTNSLYTDAVVSLWASVAEHFAANARTDLYFELLNEVEQSGGTDAVDADVWTAFAEQLIQGIRQYDPTRPIIFGDVEWYGISSLTKRTPFADTNIIYAFHFYEPFIFTHQGTSWTDLGATHDIPYPYAADRWSEYYEELGFDPTDQPSWVISLANSYYRDGNRSALRNAVLKAKQWGVDNNVPVICNELGAYDGTSTKEDRVSYYRDVIGIFEELAIPWQHWFMIMDATTGAIDTELETAFGLN